jgi:hypothetical protein
VNRLCRIFLLSLFALLVAQPADLLAPRVSAAGLPASPSKTKKKRRHKPKEVILKGHHGKKNKRPA